MCSRDPKMVRDSEKFEIAEFEITNKFIRRLTVNAEGIGTFVRDRGCRLYIFIYLLGYGNTTPVTIVGRLLLILYAVIGVPIAVSMYGVAGKLVIQILTHCVKEIENKIFKVKVREERYLERKVLLCGIAVMLLSMLLGTSITMRDEMENWTFATSLYFWFVSLTTIGYCDLHFDRNKHLNSPWFLLLAAGNLLFGLDIVAAVIELFAMELENMRNTDEELSTEN